MLFPAYYLPIKKRSFQKFIGFCQTNKSAAHSTFDRNHRVDPDAMTAPPEAVPYAARAHSAASGGAVPVPFFISVFCFRFRFQSSDSPLSRKNASISSRFAHSEPWIIGLRPPPRPFRTRLNSLPNADTSIASLMITY